MEDTLISFETLKLAREKGFHTPTEEIYSNITQSLLAKWLRDKYTLVVQIHFDTICYGYTIFNPFGMGEFTPEKWDLWEYEDALEHGLQEALNLIKS